MLIYILSIWVSRYFIFGWGRGIMWIWHKVLIDVVLVQFPIKKRVCEVCLSLAGRLKILRLEAWK